MLSFHLPFLVLLVYECMKVIVYLLTFFFVYSYLKLIMMCHMSNIVNTLDYYIYIVWNWGINIIS